MVQHLFRSSNSRDFAPLGSVGSVFQSGGSVQESPLSDTGDLFGAL